MKTQLVLLGILTTSFGGLLGYNFGINQGTISDHKDYSENHPSLEKPEFKNAETDYREEKAVTDQDDSDVLDNLKKVFPGELSKEVFTKYQIANMSEGDLQNYIIFENSRTFSRNSKDMIRYALSNLTKKNPRLAIDCVNSLSGADKVSYLSDVIMYWGTEDPVSALNWTKINIKNHGIRENLYREVCNASWKKNPSIVFSLINELGAQKISGSLWKSIESNEGFQKMLSLTAEIQSNDDRIKYVESSIREWASMDSAAALSWISDNENRLGIDRYRLYQDFAVGFSSNNSINAFDWATKLDPDMQSHVMPSIIMELAHQGNIAYSMNWVSSADTSVFNDELKKSIALSIAYENPDLSVKWAKSQNDYGNRMNTLIQIGRRLAADINTAQDIEERLSVAEDDNDRDLIVKGMAKEKSFTDPIRGVEIAGHIVNGSARFESIYGIILDCKSESKRNQLITVIRQNGILKEEEITRIINYLG